MAVRTCAALACCSSPACLSRTSATAPTCRTPRRPAGRVPCRRVSPTSRRCGARCWAACGGSRTGEKKSRRSKVRRTEARNEKFPQRDQVVQLLEAGALLRVGGRLVRGGVPVLLWPGSLDAPHGRVPVGHLGGLRRSLQRDAGGRRVHANGGGAHLQHQAPAPDRAAYSADR